MSIPARQKNSYTRIEKFTNKQKKPRDNRCEGSVNLEVDTISVVADAGYDSSGDIAGLIAKGFDPHVCGANYDICIPCEKSESEYVLRDDVSIFQIVIFLFAQWVRYFIRMA